MPAKFTNHIREFVANSFITSIDAGKVSEWLPNYSYNIGQRVSANGNVYVCSVAGTSGTILPSHISDEAADGSTSWIYIESLRTDKLFEGNLYMAIGQPIEWTDPLNPPSVAAIDSTETSVINNAITFKKVGPNDAKACVVKHLWTSGAVYSQYDDSKEFDEYVQPFYVVTDDLRIYKCLDNNNGAQSISKPSNLNTLPFRTGADGYVWKFMGVVDSADASIFMTDDFAPVTIVKSSTENAEQWSVQQSAQANSISAWEIQAATGAFNLVPSVTVVGTGSSATASGVTSSNVLQQVYVNNPGTGYSKSSTYAIISNGVAPTVTTQAAATATINSTTGAITSVSINSGAAGSGYPSQVTAVILGTAKTGTTITPAVLNVVVNGDSLSSIGVVSGGANYATAQVVIIPSSAGAVATPIMAPVNGHGKNIIKELGASTVMVSMKLTNSVSDAGYLLTDTGSDFHQVSLVTDIVDKYTGTFATANLLMGPEHPDYASTSNENPTLTTYKSKVQSGSGIVLYINNIKKVIRSSDQEEDIKVAITL